MPAGSKKSVQVRKSKYPLRILVISHRIAFFALLLLTLAVYAERSDRTQFETLEVDIAAAIFTDAVLVVVDFSECLVDFVDELAVSVAETEQTVALLEKVCLIRFIAMEGLAVLRELHFTEFFTVALLDLFELTGQ